MFDTNFISVLYFEWWARLPSAWLQVQSLLGVSEECLNLLSVSKNHHHIKKEQIHKSCKSRIQDNMIFSKDSDSYSPFTLHVQGKTCCVVLPPCHFAFKKTKKKVHKELFLLQACSGWGSGVMFWSHAMCVTNHWASTKKKESNQQ